MTLEALNKRIKTTSDLRNIVSTMKLLSSVSIGQYEKALASLKEYGHTVRQGFLGLILNSNLSDLATPLKTKTPRTIAIVIGSDNGLVGGFNREIITEAHSYFEKGEYDPKDVFYIAIGKRVALMLESAQKHSLLARYPIMNSLKEIASIASTILLKLTETIAQKNVEQVLLFYHLKEKGEIQKIKVSPLMPLPYKEFLEMKREKWKGTSFPMITANPEALKSALIHEFLTVSLAGALTASLMAEHYTRMVNMQQAEKNIDETLEQMNLEYQQARQTNITDELIDIISGAESIKKKK